MQSSLTLTALLARAVKAAPDAPAIVTPRISLSYRQLQYQSSVLAQAYADLGVQAGDRVAVWLPNQPEWIVSLLACSQLGAAVVAVNTRFRSVELADVLERAGPRLLVLSPRFRSIDFREIVRACPQAALRSLSAIVTCGDESTPDLNLNSVQVLPFNRLMERPGLERDASSDAADCVLFTTSGTTSKPKLVRHTQRSIAQHGLDTARTFGYDEPGSRILGVTPFSGVSGFGMPVASLAAIQPFVFSEIFDAAGSLEMIRRERVSHTHVNHEIIRRWFESVGDDGFPPMKVINCGSGIARLLARADELGAPLLSIYGSSEMQARYSRQLPGKYPDRRGEAGGFPIGDGAGARASDPETRKLLAPGEKGELELRGPSQMCGYLGDAQATGRALTDDGYVRTGDFGFVRADGSFVLENRMGDVLRLSGFLTSPSEIERVLNAHPSVSASQVVGVETQRGTRAAAFVITGSGSAFGEAEIIRYCADQMAPYKVPVRVFAIEEFPMTAGANAPKVLKVKLREMAQARLDKH
jgi:fatty-acyl-CoA synthase